MAFLDIWVILVGFSLLVAWYVPDDTFSEINGDNERVPVRSQSRNRKSNRS